MSNGQEQQSQPPLEIGVLGWETDNFTLEGQRPELEAQLRPGTTILYILLRTNGGWKQLRNAYFRRIEIRHLRPRFETTNERLDIVQTVFWYEELP